MDGRLFSVGQGASIIWKGSSKGDSYRAKIMHRYSRRRRFSLVWVSRRSRFLSVRKFSFHLSRFGSSFREKPGRFGRNLSTQRAGNTRGACKKVSAAPHKPFFRGVIPIPRKVFLQTGIYKILFVLKNAALVILRGLDASLATWLFKSDLNHVCFSRKLTECNV